MWSKGHQALKFVMVTSIYPRAHHVSDAMVIRHLSKELIKRGHEVHVICSADVLRKHSLQKIYPCDVSVEDDIKVHRLKSLPGMTDFYLGYFLGRSLDFRKKLGKTLGGIKPDVVNHHNIAYLGYKVLQKHGNYLSLYTAHDLWLICQRSFMLNHEGTICTKRSCLQCMMFSGRPIQLWRFARDFKETVRKQDAIISPSKFTQQKLSKVLGMDVKRIPFFVSHPPENLEDSGFSDYFLYAGKLESHKGVMDLLEAYRRWSSNISAKLVIAGKGKLTYGVLHFICKYSLEKKIIYVGWLGRERLLSFLKNARALVIPSRCAETFPIIALEAISVGTPVVGSNAGGTREIVKIINGSARALFRPKDINGIGKTLAAFHREKGMSQRIREIYQQEFSPESYVHRYYRLIQATSRSSLSRS